MIELTLQEERFSVSTMSLGRQEIALQLGVEEIRPLALKPDGTRNYCKVKLVQNPDESLKLEVNIFPGIEN
jgi:hypothetical protein